jgi:uncharacterized protein
METDATPVVERLFSALAKGDVAAVSSLMNDTVRFTTGGRTPISGSADGKQAVFAKMQKIAHLTAGTARLDLVSVTAAGPELALVHARRQARVGHDSVDADVAMVVKVADGVIVEVADVLASSLEDFWRRVAGNA